MSSGGARASGGITYQHRVAAYFAANSLAGDAAPALPGLDPQARVETIWLETTHALDDVKVGANLGRDLLIQAKRTLDVSENSGGELAKVCRQLVHAYLAGDHNDTQFVLVVGPSTHAPIRVHLRDVLANARDQPEKSQPRHVAPSTADRRVYDRVVAHLERETRSRLGRRPRAEEIRRILRRTYLLVLDVEPDGSDARNAEILLRAAVVRDANQAGNAWSRLLELCGELARRESHIDRRGLQDALMNNGIHLQAPPDIRADVQRLQLQTDSVLELLRARAAIVLPNRTIKIVRNASRALTAASQHRSLVVVGDAGTGKTGCLSDALSDDVEVVAIAAEELEAHTQVQLAQELRLSRPLHEVLQDSPTQQGLLVIDGIDAARDDATRRTLIEVLERVVRDNGRFRVLATMRTFDVRNSERLQRALAADPADAAPGYQLADLARVAHFAVPPLTRAELDQLASEAPEVDAVLRDSPPAFYELAAVPFNLRLLVELLLSSGSDPDELKLIDTQSRLLEAYWKERVLRPAEQADNREWLLRHAAEQMVADRRLHVPRRVLQGQTNEALRGLLHDNVLVERVLPHGLVNRDIVSFSHNVLFDYAVARLLLRVPDGELLDRLERQPGLLLSIPLSLELHFRWLWGREPGHRPFWTLALALAGRRGVRAIGKTCAPGLAVQLVESSADLLPLIEALDATDGSRRSDGELFLIQLTGALLAEDPHRLVGDGRPWAWFAHELSERLRPELLFAIRATVQHLLDG